MTKEIEWFRFVRHAEVADYEARGWVFESDLPLPHGSYSVLMRWPFDGTPK